MSLHFLVYGHYVCIGMEFGNWVTLTKPIRFHVLPVHDVEGYIRYCLLLAQSVYESKRGKNALLQRALQ